MSTPRADVDEWDDAAGIWRQSPAKAALLGQRAFQNAVALPTKKVFIVGGSSMDPHNNPADTFMPPVPDTELYDPGPTPASTGSSIALAPDPSGIDRFYHQLALYLPDGRILVCGGEGEQSKESAMLFSPPYLFQGPRPQINSPSLPAAITYGNSFTFTATTTNAAHGLQDFQAVLMRPGCATHHIDFEASLIELSVTGMTVVEPRVAQFTVQAPANASFGPPGYYMLILLETGIYPSQDKVPSIARFVKAQ